MNVSTKLLVQIAANSSQFVTGINQANKHLNVFQKSLVSLKNTLAGTFGAYAVINGISNAVSTLAEFDRQMTSVRAITGAMGDEFDRLEKSALNLGTTTQYTAKQVAELQLEFGRLGFSTQEILKSTKATIDLATATGEGLARSAEIAGSTLRAFQLDASEMGRVTDVMASALNKSALTLDTFADAIKYVSPVAKATGVSLEETSAMMSVLADAGIKGTQAGTSLRRIFTMLTNSGKPLQDRLDELAKKGITLADANDEVGLYAQTALLQLTALMPRVKELTKEFQSAQGATEAVADVMEQNLAVSLTKAGNAYDAWILSLKESKGIIKGVADEVARFFTVLAGGEGADIIRFQEILRAIQGSLQQGNGVRFGQFNTLKDLAKELGKELIIIRDEVGKITAIYERTGMTILGPPATVDIASKMSATIQALTQHQIEQNRIRQQAIDQQKALNEKYKEALEIAKQITDQQTDAMMVNKYNPVIDVESGFTPDGSFDASSPLAGLELPPQEEIQSWFAEFGVTYDEWSQNILDGIARQEMAWMYWGDVIADVIDNVIAKNQKLIPSILETTGRIIDASRDQIAAYLKVGIAKAFSINPAAGFAIATVGLSAISGLLKRAAKTYDVNTRSTNVSGTNRMEVYGRFEMSGKTAVALVRSGSYSNGRTG